MFSMAGIPPFLGFWAKLAVLRATIQGDLMWLAIVGIVFAVIGCFYYLRVVKVMYFDPPPQDAPAPRQARPVRLVLAANALALLVLGLFWNPLMAWCLRAFT
jgi:NADH-quinone oxidoreductase subunit N